MKKQLLFNFRMAAFAALTLLTAQSSFAQTTYTWGGATSTDFLDGTNWNAVPDFSLITNSFTISTGTTNSPILGTDYPSTNNTCAVVIVNTGASLSTNGNMTTATSTNTVNGTLNVNGGTFKSRLYIGNAAATTAVVNVATGATLSGVGAWKISVDQSPTTPGTLNVNGGTYEMTTGSSLTIGGTSASRKGILNINTGLVKFTGTATLSLGNASTTATGTVNQAGGSLEYNTANLNNGGVINITGGSFKMLNVLPTINATNTSTSGVINIAGGTLEASGPLAIGNSTTTTAGVTVNVNSGTMNIAGALNISAPTGVYTGLVTIDAGSIVLDGDQTAGIAALVTAGRITVSGAALAAGKTISNTYDAVSGKTTVVAIAAPLGVNDVTLDANSIVVYAQDKNIKIQSGNGILSEVTVYDLTGRLVASKKSIRSNETSIALNASKAVYVVKVTTADGNVVTKKIVQ